MKNRIAKLIDVKTIVTLILTLTYCYCILVNGEVNENFSTLYIMVISFYFGTQLSKNSNKEENANG